jgi:transposase InsO family protein
MQVVYTFESFVVGYARKAMYIQDITHHPQKHIVEYRVKVITFYDKYGLSATKEAFAVSRATVFNWKRLLKANHGRLSALAPASHRPHSLRQPQDYIWHKQQIIELRAKYPGLGKDKLKVLLDTNRTNPDPLSASISVSTVGRLVQDLQRRGQLPTRHQLTMLANTGRLVNKLSAKPRLNKTRRGGFKPQQPGDLVQVDCVIKLLQGIRRYVISAIDYHSEFAFSYGYTSLSSRSATDFLVKLRQVAPFTVARVQTDNGSEFYKHFHDATEKLSITHFWNYPRSPKMNAKIERYNRTIQEEFVDWHLDDLALDIKSLNRQMMDYLIWYNTERPHWTLHLKSPMQYLLEHLQLLPAESNMLWTDTFALQRRLSLIKSIGIIIT